MLPPNRAHHLKNLACPYCGIELTDAVASDRDHVIGRRFVPKGVLDAQWNIVLRSCRACNSKKADLEDDVSAVAMQPDAAGEHASTDPRLRAEASRKARKSISRRTGKPLAAGEEPLTIRGSIGSATMTFTMVGPPQIDEKRLFAMARYHIAAFFYLTSYDSSTGRGGLLPGLFYGLSAARKQDWGNAHMRWFMETTANWARRVHGIGANNFFKIESRRRSDKDDVWSWALEWNQNFRIIGFFGREDLIARLEEGTPVMVMESVDDGSGTILRYRAEVPLTDGDDQLFRQAEETQVPAAGS